MTNSHLNFNSLQKLIDVGLSLSKEKNIDILLEKILTEAREISNSDGGTLYLMIDNGTRLEFTIVQNASMNMFSGGTHGKIDSIYPVKLSSPHFSTASGTFIFAIYSIPALFDGSTLYFEWSVI